MDFATYWITVPPAGNALALPLWVFLLLTRHHRGDGDALGHKRRGEPADALFREMKRLIAEKLT